MKTHIVLDLFAVSAGFIMLCCLLSEATVIAGIFLWISVMLGGISMSLEAKAVVANRIIPIKSLHDWK